MIEQYRIKDLFQQYKVQSSKESNNSHGTRSDKMLWFFLKSALYSDIPVILHFALWAFMEIPLEATAENIGSVINQLDRSVGILWDQIGFPTRYMLYGMILQNCRRRRRWFLKKGLTNISRLQKLVFDFTLLLSLDSWVLLSITTFLYPRELRTRNICEKHFFRVW